MKNAVFWDVTPCGSSKNRRLGVTYRLHQQGDKNLRAGNVRMEALVWNTGLRIQRGVGVAGSGVDLLNSQTTRLQSEIPYLRWMG
jgi:hypothetical protein